MNNFTTSFRDTQMVLANSADTFFREFALYAPKILGALIILIIGFILAAVLRNVVKTVLNWAGFAEIAKKTEFDLLLTKMGITRTATSMLASLVYWIVVLIFLMAAFDTLGLQAVTNALTEILSYIPNVIAAAAIIVIALLLGRFVRRVITTSLEQFGIKMGSIVAVIAQGFIIVIGSVIAASQLGIDVSILIANITVIITGIVFTMVLAFGLGGRAVAANILASYHTREIYKTGMKATICGHEGIVKDAGIACVVLESAGQDLVIPNAQAIAHGSLTHSCGK